MSTMQLFGLTVLAALRGSQAVVDSAKAGHRVQHTFLHQSEEERWPVHTEGKVTQPPKDNDCEDDNWNDCMERDYVDAPRPRRERTTETPKVSQAAPTQAPTKAEPWTPTQEPTQAPEKINGNWADQQSDDDRVAQEEHDHASDTHEAERRQTTETHASEERETHTRVSKSSDEAATATREDAAKASESHSEPTREPAPRVAHEERPHSEPTRKPEARVAHEERPHSEPTRKPEARVAHEERQHSEPTREPEARVAHGERPHSDPTRRPESRVAHTERPHAEPAREPESHVTHTGESHEEEPTREPVPQMARVHSTPTREPESNVMATGGGSCPELEGEWTPGDLSKWSRPGDAKDAYQHGHTDCSIDYETPTDKGTILCNPQSGGAYMCKGDVGNHAGTEFRLQWRADGSRTMEYDRWNFVLGTTTFSEHWQKYQGR